MPVPSIHMSRSRFDLSYSYKTMFNEGDLIPFYCQEIYPGDSLNVNSSTVIRTTVPFVRPIMDNLFLDVYYFFVPHRLSYDRWCEVMGENVQGYWTEEENPEVPQIDLATTTNAGAAGQIYVNSLANYFGIPAGDYVESLSFSCLPIRDYALIWNEWFRNENVQEPVYVNTGDYVTNPKFNNNDFAPDNIYGKVAKVNKYKDYFTACLPEPQKGDAVDIMLNKVAPVGPLTDRNDLVHNDLFGDGSDINRLNLISIAPPGGPTEQLLGIDTDGWLASLPGSEFVGGPNVVFDNLGADLHGLATVNDLRFAFALQRMLEKDARIGTRYREYLYGHFGVISPDARMQVPEFLGGKRIPLNVSEVAQTSGTSGSSYQAQVAGKSLSNGFAGFNKGFVEHGFVIGLCCVRQKHTYQQAIDKFWMRKGRYDFYDPSFAYIGEQPVYNYEIAGNNTGNPMSAFGYNEAYADLRFRFSRVTGSLSTNANQGFDIWHLGDYYAGDPYLDSDFTEETNIYLNRALAVGSATAPNFVLDTYHQVSAIRVLPTFGVPGLIDHA